MKKHMYFDEQIGVLNGNHNLLFKFAKKRCVKWRIYLKIEK